MSGSTVHSPAFAKATAVKALLTHTVLAAAVIQLSNTFYEDLVKLCELEGYVDVTAANR